jgi:hypothetical protein
MARTIVFLFLGVITLGVLATPGFAVVGVLLLLFLFGAVAWWIGLVVATHGDPGEAVARTPRHRFLGPGGPDDPFADVPFAGEPSAEARDLRRSA